MLNDITLCHGEGNLGRTCALRHSCQRYVDLSTLLPVHMRAQSQMLCRPTFMLVGDGSEQRNTYRYYIPVGQNKDTAGRTE